MAQRSPPRTLTIQLVGDVVGEGTAEIPNDPDVDTLQTDQDSLRVELMARLDRLQDAVNTLRDDIGVNFWATDRVRKGLDDARVERIAMGKQMSAMERQIMRLQTEVRILKGEL